MGKLAHTSCYLVGPVEHDSLFGRDWRETISKHLLEIGVKVYNPLDRPKWMSHIEPFIPPSASRREILSLIENDDTDYIESQRLVRAICLRYISTCDFIFCYLPDTKTFGTTEELVIASNYQKPIIAVCPDGIPSLWVWDLFDNAGARVFEDLDQSISHLYDINSGSIMIDALRWIFLGDIYEPELFRISRRVRG